MTDRKLNIVNRRAKYDYHIHTTFVAGVSLVGTEVKSIRDNKVNLQDAFAYFRSDNELWMKGLHISLFKEGSHNNHDPIRERQLLLQKQELRKLRTKGKEKGYSIVLLRIFENDRGIIKFEIGIGSGKKQFDKRHDLKEKDIKRQIERYD
jgi:SsrA-binding protein